MNRWQKKQGRPSDLRLVHKGLIGSYRWLGDLTGTAAIRTTVPGFGSDSIFLFQEFSKNYPLPIPQLYPPQVLTLIVFKVVSRGSPKHAYPLAVQCRTPPDNKLAQPIPIDEVCLQTPYLMPFMAVFYSALLNPFKSS